METKALVQSEIDQIKLAKSITILQARQRGIFVRSQMGNLKKYVIQMQSIIRGYLGRRKAQALKEELQGPLAEEKKSGDFQEALEEKGSQEPLAEEKKYGDFQGALEEKDSQPTMSESQICQICLCSEVELGNEIRLGICSDDCGAKVCEECLRSYFTSLICEGFLGYCPMMTCPSCPNKMIVPEETWKVYASQETFEAHKNHAEQLLTFQCGGCHSRRTLLSGVYDEHRGEEKSGEEKLDEHLRSLVLRSWLKKNDDPKTIDLTKQPKVVKLKSGIQAFLQNKETAVGLYDAIGKIFPKTIQNDNARWKLMDGVLGFIQDHERRAKLHLRYLRVSPKFRTPCCTQLHCFICRTQGWHTDRTCEEISRRQTNEDIVTCVSCGVWLAKGDGCNSVTCVCGTSFSWTQRAQQMHVLAFETDYAENPGLAAAKILFNHKDYDEDKVKRARRWGNERQSQLNDGFCQLWRSFHPWGPVQAALKYQERERNSKLEKRMQKLHQKFVDNPENVAKISNLKESFAKSRQSFWWNISKYLPRSGLATQKVLAEFTRRMHLPLPSTFLDHELSEVEKERIAIIYNIQAWKGIYGDQSFERARQFGRLSRVPLCQREFFKAYVQGQRHRLINAVTQTSSFMEMRNNGVVLKSQDGSLLSQALDVLNQIGRYGCDSHEVKAALMLRNVMKNSFLVKESRLWEEQHRSFAAAAALAASRHSSRGWCTLVQRLQAESWATQHRKQIERQNKAVLRAQLLVLRSLYGTEAPKQLVLAQRSPDVLKPLYRSVCLNRASEEEESKAEAEDQDVAAWFKKHCEVHLIAGREQMRSNWAQGWKFLRPPLQRRRDQCEQVSPNQRHFHLCWRNSLKKPKPPRNSLQGPLASRSRMAQNSSAFGRSSLSPRKDRRKTSATQAKKNNGNWWSAIGPAERKACSQYKRRPQTLPIEEKKEAEETKESGIPTLSPRMPRSCAKKISEEEYFARLWKKSFERFKDLEEFEVFEWRANHYRQAMDEAKTPFERSLARSNLKNHLLNPKQKPSSSEQRRQTENLHHNRRRDR